MISGVDVLERCCEGLASGAVVAVLAVAVGLVFRACRFLHVALGDLVTIGGAAAVWAAVAMDLPGMHAVLRSMGIVAIIAGCGAVCGGLNVALEAVVFRQLRSDPPVLSSISSVGLSLAAVSMMSMTIGPEGLSITGVMPAESLFPAFGRRPTTADILMLSTAVAVLTGVWMIRRRLLPAIAPRDTVSAFTIGERNGMIDRTIRWNFLTSGALAGTVGAVVALTFSTITSATGSHIGSKAILAAAIASLGGIRAAIVGGLVIGMLHSVAGGFVGIEWSWPMTFLLLVVLVVVAPRGFLGRVTPGTGWFPPGKREERVVDTRSWAALVPCNEQSSVSSKSTGWSFVDDVVRSRRAGWVACSLLAILYVFVPSAEGWILAVPTIGLLLMALGAGAGWVGLLHLGVPGFFSLGWAIAHGLSNPSLPSRLGAVVSAGLAAALVGAGLAACTRRLERSTFAIVTFVFSEVMLIAIAVLRARGASTDGADVSIDASLSAGMVEVGMPPDGGSSSGPWWWPLIALTLLPVTLECLERFRRSRAGLRWTAVREDEKAAASIGLSVTRSRWTGSVVSALLAGLAGGVQACSGGGPVTAESLWPATAVLVAGLGVAGSGSLRGGMLATVVVLVCWGSLSPFRPSEAIIGLQVVLGIGLVAMMRWRPAGLIESGMVLEEISFARRRMREARQWIA